MDITTTHIGIAVVGVPHTPTLLKSIYCQMKLFLLTLNIIIIGGILVMEIYTSNTELLMVQVGQAGISFQNMIIVRKLTGQFGTLI